MSGRGGVSHRLTPRGWDGGTEEGDTARGVARGWKQAMFSLCSNGLLCEALKAAPLSGQGRRPNGDEGGAHHGAGT